MSVELISLGNFDYSGLNLSSREEAIISYLIKYDIDSYNITINIENNELIFYMNLTALSQDKATNIFRNIFKLLEEHFVETHLDYFVITILHHNFTFSRKIKEDITSLIDSQNLINWTISSANLSSLKVSLFDFHHKKQHFYTFLDKYPDKQIDKKIHKI